MRKVLVTLTVATAYVLTLTACGQSATSATPDVKVAASQASMAKIQLQAQSVAVDVSDATAGNVPAPQVNEMLDDVFDQLFDELGKIDVKADDPKVEDMLKAQRDQLVSSLKDLFGQLKDQLSKVMQNPPAMGSVPTGLPSMPAAGGFDFSGILKGPKKK